MMEVVKDESLSEQGLTQGAPVKDNVQGQKESLPIYEDRKSGKEVFAHKSKHVFNPETGYQWQPTDLFVISGAELHLLYNTLDTFFKSNMPDQQKHVILHEVLKLSVDIVKRNVEDGKIVEMQKDTQEQKSL